MTAVIDRDAYSQLLVEFQPKVIESREEYENAHQILLRLMAVSSRTPEQKVFINLIATLIEEFENKQEIHSEEASPREVLLYLMEANDMKQSDLVNKKVASSGVISEIICGKRSISKAQAKALAEIFHVEPSAFI